MSRSHADSDQLGPEDRMLWETVIRGVRPLSSRQERGGLSGHASSGKVHRPGIRPSGAKGDTLPGDKAVFPSERESGPHRLNPFDSAVHRKIARGRLPVEAHVDLHELTQGEAYALLLRFLRLAQHRGLRHVLIITGKGKSSGSGGVLRQGVRHWLASAPFRSYVNAFETAARHHGGTGALYIKLRRLTPGRTS